MPGRGAQFCKLAVGLGSIASPKASVVSWTPVSRYLYTRCPRRQQEAITPAQVNRTYSAPTLPNTSKWTRTRPNTNHPVPPFALQIYAFTWRTFCTWTDNAVSISSIGLVYTDYHINKYYSRFPSFLDECLNSKRKLLPLLR